MNNKNQVRQNILKLVREYYEIAFKNKKWNQGEKITYGGRVFDEKEMQYLVDSSLDFWLTSGRYVDQFQKTFSDFLKIKYCSLTNSGSSANLLAFMALTSPKLGNRRINRGDEVITLAAGFPTTVTPILQYGAVPVFVDIEISTYNIDVQSLKAAISPKTKAIMIAHTLGNPFNLKKVKDFCDKHSLWLIEDNCDSLGAQYLMEGQYTYTGTIGDIGTSSFYPPHHMTMGEGGAVYTNNHKILKIINSFRDWGRDCWCPPGKDNTCKKRFNQQFGELPVGYDHKYVFSHFGYNLKITDMQAAIGCAQLEKLPEFIRKRQENWKIFYNELKKYEKYFILPKKTENSIPSWFGFMLTVKNNAPFSRGEIVNYLENEHIQTRMLFAGNLIMHPCFDQIRNNDSKYRVVGNLSNTNQVMENSFWFGVYPALTDEMIKYIIFKIIKFIKNKEIIK